MNINHQFTPANGVQTILVNSPMQSVTPNFSEWVYIRVDPSWRERMRASDNPDKALIRIADFTNGDAICIHTDENTSFVIGFWEGKMLVQRLEDGTE
jgi:hypothetical protein